MQTRYIHMLVYFTHLLFFWKYQSLFNIFHLGLVHICHSIDEAPFRGRGRMSGLPLYCGVRDGVDGGDEVTGTDGRRDETYS